MYESEVEESFELLHWNCNNTNCEDCALSQEKDDRGRTCVVEGKPYLWDVDKIMQALYDVRCARNLSDLEEKED